MRGDVIAITILLSLGHPGCGPYPGEHPYLAIDPEVLHLPGTVVGETMRAPLTLQNLGGGALEVTSLSLSAPDGPGWSLSAESTPFELAPDESLALQIHHTPGPGVPSSAQLLIGSNDRDRPTAAVELHGLPSKPLLVAAPASLDFGPVPSGVTVVRHVMIRNLGRATATSLAVDWPTTASDFSASLETSELAPGASVALSVSYSPRDGDEDRAILQLRYSWQIDAIAIPLRGRQDLEPPE
jgi:hypothetical protein